MNKITNWWGWLWVLVVFILLAFFSATAERPATIKDVYCALLPIIILLCIMIEHKEDKE